MIDSVVGCVITVCVSVNFFIAKFAGKSDENDEIYGSRTLGINGCDSVRRPSGLKTPIPLYVDWSGPIYTLDLAHLHNAGG